MTHSHLMYRIYQFNHVKRYARLQLKLVKYILNIMIFNMCDFLYQGHFLSEPVMVICYSV